MSILYYGGTFNPIHVGHLLLARHVAEIYEISKVIFIPAVNPYHKTGCGKLESYPNRLLLLKKATEGEGLFEVSDIESTLDSSYTYDTLNALGAFKTAEKPLLLLGDDNLSTIKNWYRFDALNDNVEFVVASRHLQVCDLGFLKCARFCLPSIHQVSSTEIRKRIQEGKSIRWIVPDVVEKLIFALGMYGFSTGFDV